MDSERRRVLQVMVTAGSIVFAGCSSDSTDEGDGGNGDDGDNPLGNGNGGNGDAGTGDTGDGSDGDDGSGGDAGIDATDEEFNHFEFEEGERYEYEVFMQNEGEGTFSWEVTDISGDQMTVEVVYDVGEVYYETTATGEKSTIQGQLMASPAGSFLGVAMFSPTWSMYQEGNLEIGNKWEVSNSDRSIVMEVVGTDVYAGVECFTSTLHENDQLVHESCVNPQLGMGLYIAFYEEGSLQVEMELVDYSPPD